MSLRTALIIDDEPDILELLEITLGRMNMQTRSARDVQEAYAWLDKEHFDLCLTDMRLPDGTGLDIIEHIQTHHSNTPVAMITAYGCVETATQALKAGAFDFTSICYACANWSPVLCAYKNSLARPPLPTALCWAYQRRCVICASKSASLRAAKRLFI